MHPIYEAFPLKILPGKYEQIDAFYDAIAPINSIEAGQPIQTYYPFLSQPLAEYALSLPTYQLFNKGYDRYPLRQSIASHFKTDTVWRRDKGQGTGFMQLGIKKNLDYILDICLNGEFIKQGFVDMQELHKTIILISNGETKNIWPFMQLASCEIFLNYWRKN